MSESPKVAAKTVGVCAPGGIVDRERLGRGVAELGRLGFTVKLADGLLERSAFTAGTLRRRLEALEAMLCDEEVHAIICARGGAGTAQLLEHLDAELIRSRPKALIGYSDITYLHLLYARLGLRSHYGPMVACELSDGSYDQETFLRAVLGGGPTPWAPIESMRPLKSGSGVGVLRGGCLALLAAACGTAWSLPRDEDTILLLEDVDEPPYRIDRYLLQLRQSGVFARTRGIVFGEMKRCAPGDEEGYTLDEVILNALEGILCPIAIDLPIGHACRPILTLPLGACARLTCDQGARLTIEGPVNT
jgi:muramoyltetrapeptide carboxypeptidase